MKTRRRNPDYDPNWDYELRPRPLADVAKAVAGARSIANLYASLLDMQPPTIHYVADTGDHVARYINGTSSSPVVVVNDKALAKWAKKYRVALRDAAESTLIHEMGHAYVDSMGLSGELADEERIVEEPAGIFFRSMDIEAAANQLRHAVAGKAKANPRRRKNGSLAPLVVGGLALAAGAVAFHGQRTPEAASAAGWKRELLPSGFGKGYRYTRTIDGMKYEIDDEKATYRISLRVGERLERIHPPGTDWGSWPSVAEAQRAAEDDARFHVRKNPRRRKNGLLGAVTLLGLGFAGGAYLESEKPFVRRLRERSRGPAKVAREQAARLQREVFTPAPAKRSTATDPAWRRERSPDGKGYAHLRTINGVDYEVFERIYSDGSKAIHLEAGDDRERILAPNGKEDGWVSVAAAKKAAEADAKTRKNPRRRK